MLKERGGVSYRFSVQNLYIPSYVTFIIRVIFVYKYIRPGPVQKGKRDNTLLLSEKMVLNNNFEILGPYFNGQPFFLLFLFY